MIKNNYVHSYTLTTNACNIIYILIHHPSDEIWWKVATVAIEILSDMCAKLRTVTASNNRDHTPQYLLLLLARATHIYCCSSHTSCLWWITKSTQHHRRGCNNIPSFSQRTTAIARSLCEGWTRHDLHILVTAPFCCDRKSQAACAQSFALWQQATIEIMHRNLSYDCLLAPLIYIVVLCAHPVRGESHNQRNTTREVATPHVPYWADLGRGWAYFSACELQWTLKFNICWIRSRWMDYLSELIKWDVKNGLALLL